MSTFEVVRGPEGDCLLLDDTRISGPKPWGGGAVTKTFHTDGAYAVVPKDELDRLKAENVRLRELVPKMARALGVGTDWCYSTCSHEFMCDPLKDECPIVKAMQEFGIEVEK